MATYELLIKKVGDELEVTIESETGEVGETEVKQEERRASGNPARNKKMKELKHERRKEGQQDHHADIIGPHVPIIVLNHPGNRTDTIVWKCTEAFMIDVEIDEGYNKASSAANPPRSIFQNVATNQDFSVMPQMSAVNDNFPKPGGGFYQVVRGAFTKDNQALDHKFYKATIWSQGVKLDPDYFCDR